MIWMDDMINGWYVEWMICRMDDMNGWYDEWMIWYADYPYTFGRVEWMVVDE